MKKWLFLALALALSIGSHAAEPNPLISFIGVGDIMMGTDFPDKYEILPPDGGKELFMHVKHIFERGDVVFGNIEQVLADGGKCAKNINLPNMWAFRCPTSCAVNLKEAHFNMMSIANNHAWDFDLAGIASTMKALDSLNIEHSGPIGDIGSIMIKGKSIGLIAFSTNKNGHNLREIPEAKKSVHKYSKMYDLLIVSFHGGAEGYSALHTKNEEEYLGSEHRGNVVQFSHAVIDSGADLVIGHGPHVPRAIELYNGKLIAYSLGNFCTYGIISIKKEKGLAPILEVHMDMNGNFNHGRIYSFKQQPPGIPVPDSKNGAAKLMKNLSRKDFPHSKLLIDNMGNISIKE